MCFTSINAKPKKNYNNNEKINKNRTSENSNNNTKNKDPWHQSSTSFSLTGQKPKKEVVLK